MFYTFINRRQNWRVPYCWMTMLHLDHSNSGITVRKDYMSGLDQVVLAHTDARVRMVWMKRRHSTIGNPSIVMTIYKCAEYYNCLLDQVVLAPTDARVGVVWMGHHHSTIGNPSIVMPIYKCAKHYSYLQA
jgi:hypothetical protein